MKKILIIGSGISGLTSAIECAASNNKVTLVSPFPSERSQSVMAAGGINAVSSDANEGDTIESHIEDTLNGGLNIASAKAVRSLCTDAPEILNWLESIGVVFTRDKNGSIARRAFGGQSHRRTAFAGTSTGKQIVTALVQKARQYECAGLIDKRTGLRFHSALIHDNTCYGAVFYDEKNMSVTVITADAVIMATGGQNSIFGKTTGSALCDGYSTGRLFIQGAVLKNPEFIQYHPTAIETSQKKMLISEAARGEGGRLYYMNGDKRIYFMEDLFGKNGNLMTRDVVSKCMHNVPSQVYLDISFLGKKKIKENLEEIYDLCMTYLGIDVTKESIPVTPTVHFFMGGLAVDINHRTSIDRLYAVGECASIYHGANRLGGNSLLAALHSGKVAAAHIDKHCSSCTAEHAIPDFSAFASEIESDIASRLQGESSYSAVHMMRTLAEIMNDDMGISRTEEKLKSGIESIDYYISVCEKIIYDTSVSPYQGYCLRSLFTLARGILTCALNRRETRGAHIREDYPETSADFEKSTLIRYNNGNYDISYEREDEICW